MRKTEYKEVPQWKVVTSYSCDFCGRRRDEAPGEGKQPIEWGTHPDVKNTQVMLEEGYFFNSAATEIQRTTFDICPDCFKSKLIPWMESQGVKPHIEKDMG